MTRLSVWNPWRMMPKNLLDDNFDIVDYPDNELDMYEQGDNIIVKLKAPGFEQKDLNIRLENEGMLCLSGKIEKEEEEKSKDRKYYRKEISSQSFSRQIELPMRIDASKAKAEFKNGMLTLTLPKAPEAKPKSIQINVS